MRVKENECREKKIYDRCVSKEKNIDATWPKPSTSMNTSAMRLALTVSLTGGYSSTCSPTSAPINTSRAQMMFLEENDHRREERVASSKMRFQKLLGKKKI